MSRALNLFGSVFQSFEAECLHDRSPYVVVLTLILYLLTKETHKSDQWL